MLLLDSPYGPCAVPVVAPVVAMPTHSDPCTQGRPVTPVFGLRPVALSGLGNPYKIAVLGPTAAVRLGAIGWQLFTVFPRSLSASRDTGPPETASGGPRKAGLAAGRSAD
ncbi:hypothetical protein ON010_g18760 [Phytophthora cinnamomi]|nr:hypothetical protein ON010_g18761 [Phytophthora cinnamomi]KAJ8509464.1 hypothetical protein ON010_g18760 [Phytophthora cinnamomi]